MFALVAAPAAIGADSSVSPPSTSSAPPPVPGGAATGDAAPSTAAPSTAAPSPSAAPGAAGSAATPGAAADSPARKIFEQLDANKDGVLTFEEFARASFQPR